jgi:endoglycosylceramidase
MRSFLNCYLLLVCLLLGGCKKEVPHTTFKKLLHATRGSNPGIYDAEGRRVILRGVNYNVLGDYWVANAAIPATKSYASEDIQMMARYGFNCVRLLFSWSLLEPQPGIYNDGYIQQIRSVIEECAKYNIYVMLDMHQDAYGKYIATPLDTTCNSPNKGWDGAPLWATYTDGESTCQAGSGRESAPAVYHAFQNFWDNTNSIQDNCIAAWQQLVSATSQYENLLGYDLLNEPGLGYKEPYDSEMAKLSNYYGRLIEAIRTAEGNYSMHHIVFIENPVTYKGSGIIGLPDASLSSDDNLVAAPHHYFESIINYPVTIEAGYNTLLSAAAKYSAALFIGEWGFFGAPANDVNKVKRFAAAEDANFGSSTWWQWCQAPGDPHSISWDGNSYSPTSMHLIELDQNAQFTGNLNQLYLQVLSRTRPNFIAGTPSLLSSNPDSGEMILEATTTTQSEVELWIPNGHGIPQVTGANVKLKKLNNVDGGYIALVEVAGSYRVQVSF